MLKSVQLATSPPRTQEQPISAPNQVGSVSGPSKPGVVP